MSGKSSTLSKFLHKFVEILEKYQPNLSFSFCSCCHLLHFLQILSYLLKVREMQVSEPKFSFISQIIFYSNFVNFLGVFSLNSLTTVAFILIEIHIFVIILAFSLIFLRKHVKLRVLSRVLPHFFKLLVLEINVFFWILLIPFLELFTNALDCQAFNGFFQPSRCESLEIRIFSIFALISLSFLAFLGLWANRAHNFLENGLLRLNFGVFEAILLTLHIVLVVFSPYFVGGSAIFADLLVLSLIFLWICSVLVRSPFSYREIHERFLLFSAFSLTICAGFVLSDAFSLPNAQNFCYILAVSLVFVLKTARKTIEKSNAHLYEASFTRLSTLTLDLEHFFQQFQGKNSKEFANFLFSGLLRNHISTCKVEHCVFSADNLEKLKGNQQEISRKIKENQENPKKNRESQRDFADLMSLFISACLYRALQRKDARNSVFFEEILLKYSCFLAQMRGNPIKSLFELERAQKLNKKSPSLYFRAVNTALHRFLHEKIRDIERKSSVSLEKSKEITLSAFAKQHKSLTFLRNSAVELLRFRRTFFEETRDGFSSFDEFCASAERFSKKALKTRANLENLLTNSGNSLLNSLVPLKFRSIFACAALNRLDEGVKAEEELEKLLKREKSAKNSLNSSSLLENNVVLLQASFLKSHGELLESAKTEKIAKFFGFSREEVANLKNIRQLMPKLVAGFHEKLVQWHMKTGKFARNQENNAFFTYAALKNGLLFPVKLYIGHCFEIREDFVFQAAVLRVSEEFEGLLFDKYGNLQGISAGFREKTGERLRKIANEDLLLLNIFNFMPELREIIEKHRGFEEKSLKFLRNLSSGFEFPTNLEEILEIIREKAKEEREKSQFSSSKSLKSAGKSEGFLSKSHESSKNSRFMTKFMKTSKLSMENRRKIQQRYLEHSLTNFEIVRELFDATSLEKARISYDLSFFEHQYSETESLEFASLQVNRLNFAKSQGNYGNSHEMQGSYLKTHEIRANSGENQGNSQGNSGNSQENQGNSQENDQFFDPSLIENSDFPSNFIVMPPPNIPEFRETHRSEAIETEFFAELPQNNKLLTTEANENAKEPPHITENPEKPQENPQKIGGKRDFSQNSSQNSSKVARNFFETRAKTSNQRIFDMNEVSSKSSSLSSLKKTFSVFNMMKNIEKSTPNSVFSAICTKSVEIIAICVYCVVLLVLSQQYIEVYYEPLEEAVLNFSKLLQNYVISSVALVEIQLTQGNFSSFQENSALFSLISQDFAHNFQSFREICELEREKSNFHEYQGFFKETRVNVTEFATSGYETVSFVRFLDFITMIFLETTQISKLNAMKIDYFLLNFPQFYAKIQEILALIWQEFDSTHEKVFVSIEITLIFLILLIFALKLFEFWKTDLFYREIAKILSIFLRTSANEAIREILYCDQILEEITNSEEKFLHVDFAEELINRKTVRIFEEIASPSLRISSKTAKNPAKPSKNAKNPTKRTNHMNPFSRWPRVLLGFLTFFLVFGYFLLNFFYWNTVNNEISVLIDTTNFFQSIYILPTTLLLAKNLIFRDKLVENSFAKGVNSAQRLRELYSFLEEISEEMQTSNAKIPSFALKAEEQLKDPQFSQIVKGNLCDFAYFSGEITQELRNLCGTLYNGAFSQGIMAANTELANVLQNFNGSLWPDKENSLEIAEIVKGNTVSLDFLASFLIDLANEEFYLKIEEFHKNIMLQQQNYLKIMLIITTVFVAGGLIVGLGVYWRFVKRKFRNISLVLSFIPYEKLMNDEQTVFLIKKFLKN